MNVNESINFMGDLVLGDQPVKFGFGFDSLWKDKQYNGVFEQVLSVTQNSKYNVANFEAVIKIRKYGDNSVSKWAMCCDENICKELKKANINIVSVANNHTMDYERQYFDYTVACLQKSGIEVIGLATKPYTKIEIENKKIAVISASYLKINSKDNIGYFYMPDKEEWLKVISECNDCDTIVAYIHWGNEFIKTPTEKQREILNMLIGVGVNIVIGHHSHILQIKETIDSVPVIYSLGNFVSDYWQKRLRKTEIINLNAVNELHTKECKINKSCCPEIIDAEWHKISFQVIDKEESVFLNRLRMRFEYLFLIIFKFYKIKNKPEFLKWLYKRVVYVLKYSFKEIKQPDIIYEHYRN